MVVRYRGDPYWITCRYEGTCNGCQAKIAKGQEAFYYPKGKALYCKENGCGDRCFREFLAAAEDEDVLMAGYSPAFQAELEREAAYDAELDNEFFDGDLVDDYGY